MERWSALMPDRHATGVTTPSSPLVGRLPVEAWIVVMHFLPVPDLPQLALTNSKLAHLVNDDRVWRCKLAWLDYTGPGAVDYRSRRPNPIPSSDPTPPPPQPQPYRDHSEDEDGFGDFIDIRGQQQLQNDDDDDGDDDGFGAFQDGDFASFAPVDHRQGDPTSSKPAAVGRSPAVTTDDDLLLLFDDVDLSGIGTTGGLASGPGGGAENTHPPPPSSLSLRQQQPPRRPPAVSSKLTFATPPVEPLPATTTTTRRSSSSSEGRQKTEQETHQQQQGGGSGSGSPLLRVYQQHVSLLLPFYTSLQTQSTSSLVFTTTTFTSAPSSGPITMTPLLRARLLASLNRFCHPLVAPTRSRTQRLLVARNVQSAIDFYESTLLAEFERADAAAGPGGRDEATMKDKANVLWELNQSTTLSQVFVQKRETLFSGSGSGSALGGGGGGGGGGSHDPLKNLTKIETPSGALADGIDFSAMDRFMTSILSTLTSEGALIARVFPPQADVLLYFLERVANDVVSEYITSLLAAAQPLRKPLFLLATAATFGQVYRLVDCVLEIRADSPSSSSSTAAAAAGRESEADSEEEPTRPPDAGGGGPSPPPPPPLVTKERAEDVVFRMFEPLMDDYLAEEGEWIREVLEGICDEWDRKTAHDLAVSDPTFLASQNPAQVKRNVLAGFTKVLLLPVTIIPKTAEFGLNAITYGATGVIDTFASLGNQFSNNAGGGGGGGDATAAKQKGLSSAVHAPSVDSVAGNQQQQPSPEEGSTEPATPSALATVPIESSASAWGGDDAAFNSAPHRLSVDANGHIGLLESQSDSAAAPPIRRSTVPTSVPGRFDRLQLLLSLDTALQLIQADRDSLKRIQTFIRYPGVYGRKVRDAIEEVFLVLLQVLSEKHVCPAFAQATQQMAAYKPSEHEDVIAVAPLVQFFELVHIGDTIQQMVDVYFEKEMAAYIDRRDFLNAVVREKKKFESALDDAVAQGLNAAVNILMVSVEHLITTRQGLRDFTPDRDDDFDLTPTRACVEAIETLKQHCDMLRGSTDKQILEVFNQEVGIRLHGILLKHLKRQIVSTQGGLRLIADLNAYHAFVSTLRQPQVTAYFTSLKMVGELFLIDDPKELGALVRDTSRYEGTLSQEDLYELVQRRADWQKIERLVDKAVYGLECLVC